MRHYSPTFNNLHKRREKIVVNNDDINNKGISEILIVELNVLRSVRAEIGKTHKELIFKTKYLANSFPTFLHLDNSPTILIAIGVFAGPNPNRLQVIEVLIYSNTSTLTLNILDDIGEISLEILFTTPDSIAILNIPLYITSILPILIKLFITLKGTRNKLSTMYLILLLNIPNTILKKIIKVHILFINNTLSN